MALKFERNEIFGYNDGPDTWLWCLHCERAYQLKDLRQEDGLQLCHYADCDGDTVMDGWYWSQICEGHADYPAVPVLGVKYPMYG